LVILGDNWKNEHLNYLGHLYFSDDNHDIMLGNLLGDFVKGNKFDRIDARLHSGVVLHRKIDLFIDNHPAVLELNRQLYPLLTKISGISIDIIFDHLLAKNWGNFHNQELEHFLGDFFQFAQSNKHYLPSNYNMLLDRLWEKKMLHQYVDIDTIDKIATYIQTRLSFATNLHHTKSVYLAHESLFEEVFFVYMEDAEKSFRQRKM